MTMRQKKRLCDDEQLDEKQQEENDHSFKENQPSSFSFNPFSFMFNSIKQYYN
jgi:hypothetical protein